MSSDAAALTATDAVRYLEERGLVHDPSEVQVRQLDGGISNVVFLIE